MEIQNSAKTARQKVVAVVTSNLLDKEKSNFIGFSWLIERVINIQSLCRENPPRPPPGLNRVNIESSSRFNFIQLENELKGYETSFTQIVNFYSKFITREAYYRKSKNTVKSIPSEFVYVHLSPAMLS